MTETDRLPPHNAEMEGAIIGCILQKPELLDECQSRFKVGADVFYEQSHRLIYTAILGLRSDGEAIDLLTVGARLKSSGVETAYLIQCDSNAVASNFDSYANAVSEDYIKRRTLAACVEASEEVFTTKSDAESVISGIEERLRSLREIRQRDLIVNSRKASGLLNGHLEERFTLKGKRSGVVTGLKEFDDLTDGIQYGEQTIVGARPSQGKTALAGTIIRRACLIDKIPTLVITLEMSIHSLCRRILANHHKIPLNYLRHGEYGEPDFAKFASFSSLLSASPLYFMDSISGTDSNRICSAIRRAAKNLGVKLVVIDYLQKIQANGKFEKRTYEVAQVSGALKAVAVESGCALLTLAQLNREPDQGQATPAAA